MGSSIYCNQLRTQSAPVKMKIGVVLITSLLLTLVSSFSMAKPSNESKIKPLTIEQEFNQEQDKLMLSAYEGNSDAQFKLAVLYTNNQFREPDHQQAVYWYKQAARHGHKLAQYNLGHQYLTGQGVEKSEAQAMQWWLKAAKQSHALAQFNVGRGYYLGIGLEKNLAKSRHWFSQAALNNEPKSIEILKELDWHDSVMQEETVGQNDKKNSGTNTDQTSDNNHVNELKTRIIPIEISHVETPAVKTVDTKAAPIETIHIKNKLTKTTQNKSNIRPAPVAQQAGLEKKTALRKIPVPVYTTPAIRSVLVSIVEDANELRIQRESGEWLVAKSVSGFPVWLHSNFISAKGDQGKITGNNVNARSVPIIATGSIVGQLQKNELVKILQRQNEWYRVVAPEHFTTWVKKIDYHKAIANNPKQPNSDTARLIKEIKPKPVIKKHANSNNDEAWLFSQNKNHFTLQLASLDNQDSIKKFTSQLTDTNITEFHQFISIKNDEKRTFFLYGSYPDIQQAKQSASKFTQPKPWVRSFKNITQNRCISWKKQLPPPRKLNQYCIN